MTYSFSQTRTLTNGSSYNIVLTTPGSSTYSIFPIRKGRDFNFDAATYFSDGRAQYSSDGSTWKDWDAWGSTHTDGDLQFFFSCP